MIMCSNSLKSLAHPTGFEPVTSAFGGQRSIQLSYGCLERGKIYATSPTETSRADMAGRVGKPRP